MEQIFAFTESPTPRPPSLANFLQLFLDAEGRLVVCMRCSAGHIARVVLSTSEAAELSVAAAAGASEPVSPETLATVVFEREMVSVARDDGATHPEIVNGRRFIAEQLVRDTARIKQSLARAGYFIVGPLAPAEKQG